MKINHSKNTFQFASRNIVIRKADDIARTVNREFPRVSLSRINSYRNEPSAYLLYKYKDKLQKKNIKAVIDVRSSPYSSRYSQYNRPIIEDTLKKNNIYYLFLVHQILTLNIV